MAKLREHKLYAKRSKCKFAIRQVQFLGHVVDAAGVAPDPAKLRVMQEWPVPLSSKELRQSFGLAQYFGKFIQGFSDQVAKGRMQSSIGSPHMRLPVRASSNLASVRLSRSCLAGTRISRS